MKRNEDNLRDLWDNLKHTNNHILRVPEGEETKGPEKIFEEIVAKNFLNMGEETVNQVQEAQRVPGRKEPEEDTETHNNQTDKD